MYVVKNEELISGTLQVKRMTWKRVCGAKEREHKLKSNANMGVWNVLELLIPLLRSYIESKRLLICSAL